MSAVEIGFSNCVNPALVDSSLNFNATRVEAVYLDPKGTAKAALKFTVHGIMTGSLADLNLTTNKYSKFPLSFYPVTDIDSHFKSGAGCSPIQYSRLIHTTV